VSPRPISANLNPAEARTLNSLLFTELAVIYIATFLSSAELSIPAAETIPYYGSRAAQATHWQNVQEGSAVTTEVVSEKSHGQFEVHNARRRSGI
jgi:hypothetical protein